MTGSTLILHVAWFPHVWTMNNGERKELHINKRTAQEWASAVKEVTDQYPAVDEDSMTGLMVINR